MEMNKNEKKKVIFCRMFHFPSVKESNELNLGQQKNKVSLYNFSHRYLFLKT